MSPDNTRLYVVTADATTGAGQLWVYNTSTNTQIDANPGPGNGITVANNPSDIAVAGNKIYVAGDGATPTTGSVTVINANTAANTYTLGTPIAVSQKIVSIATSDAGRLYIGTNPYTFAYTEAGQPLYGPASNSWGEVGVFTLPDGSDRVYLG